MRILQFFAMFCGICCFSQQQYNLIAKDSIPLTAEHIFGIDAFQTLYYTTKDNTFYKKTKDTLVTYTNFQLGEITTADVFNPLKINLFYKNYNTVIILDNRLSEIFKIDFNTLQPYKNISHVSTGFDNTLWMFNQDLQKLELYNYKNKTTRFQSVPIPSEVLDLKSDFNNCYLLTKEYLYIYNYLGSLIAKHLNTGYTNLEFSKTHLVLRKDKKLYVLPKNETTILPIFKSDFLISQFLVINESLYIYHDNTLKHYQIKTQ